MNHIDILEIDPESMSLDEVIAMNLAKSLEEDNDEENPVECDLRTIIKRNLRKSNSSKYKRVSKLGRGILTRRALEINNRLRKMPNFGSRPVHKRLGYDTEGRIGFRFGKVGSDTIYRAHNVTKYYKNLVRHMRQFQSKKNGRSPLTRNMHQPGIKMKEIQSCIKVAQKDFVVRQDILNDMRPILIKHDFQDLAAKRIQLLPR